MSYIQRMNELAARNGRVSFPQHVNETRRPALMTEWEMKHWNAETGLDNCPPEPIEPVSIGTLVDNHPHLAEPLIDGIVRRGETANIIAPSKVGKSWLTYGIALCNVTGRKWLNRYQCTPGRVLLIDNELHAPTIAKRIPTVAEAMAIRSDEYRDQLDVVTLRGRLLDLHGIGGRIVDYLERDAYSLIIIDAWYRVIPPGESENDNATIAALFNLVDQFAEKTSAAWLLVHHSTKGSQSDKRVTDVGAGAGSQARAADAHIVLREHEEPDHVVLDAAVRSFPPIEPLTLRWEFPVWRPASDVDPARLKGRLTAGEQRLAEKDRQDVQKIREHLEEHGTATRRKLRHIASPDRLNKLLCTMEHAGEIESVPITIKGNPTEEYHLKSNAQALRGRDVVDTTTDHATTLPERDVVGPLKGDHLPRHSPSGDADVVGQGGRGEPTTSDPMTGWPDDDAF